MEKLRKGKQEKRSFFFGLQGWNQGKKNAPKDQGGTNVGSKGGPDKKKKRRG